MFQYVKNVEIHHAKITTKDAFWEVENVTIYDSELNGEYLGWHSKNLRLVNCHITGEQPLCYAHDLILENCTFGPDCGSRYGAGSNVIRFVPPLIITKENVDDMMIRLEAALS